MGCTSTLPQDEWLEIKSAPLKQFLINCRSQGFDEAYVCKKTVYEYKYVRGLREWVLAYDKQLFIEEQPVLLSPCQTDNFQHILERVAQYKTRSLEQEEQSAQLGGFPQNIGMLMTQGQKFPTFLTNYLNSGAVQPFKFDAGKQYLFVHWKLQEKLTISKSPSKARLASSKTGGLFKMGESRRYIETAFERAVQHLDKLENVVLVGVCFDKPESKAEYESYIQNEQLENHYKHIWIEQNVSMYSVDYRDQNPYDNQAFQVFRFAQNGVDSPIRSLDNSVYIVDKSGIYQAVFQENFKDEDFIGRIKQAFSEQHTNGVEDVRNRFQAFTSSVKQQDSLKQEEYRKVKKLITSVVASKVKKSDQWLQIGDTFSLKLEKLTYFAHYKKVGVVYKKPLLLAAASIKYAQSLEELMSGLKGELPQYITRDLRRRETIDKKAFFKMFNQKMRDAGWSDIRLILERHQMLYFNPEEKRFLLDRRLDQLHNAPISIGAVFSRKEKLSIIKDWLVQNEQNLARPVVKLTKDFLSNVYGFTSAFHEGQIYCPIPNVYQVAHNDSVQESNIFFSSIQSPPNPIYQSKRLFGSLQNSGIQENRLPSASVQGEECEVISLSIDWEGQDNQGEGYDQQNSLRQKKDETLIIINIDFSRQAHLQDLQTLLGYIRSKNWTRDQIRVASIGVGEPDQHFDESLTKFKFEKDMSRGIYEPWFSVDKCYLGTNYNQLLEDLYGFDHRSGIALVIDSHKKLAYRGPCTQKLVTTLDQIVGGQNSNTIYPFDHQLRNRIKSAQYEREWNKIKSFGYYDIKQNQFAKDLETFLPKHPLLKSEFWRLEIRSFQLWNQQGALIGKFYERPRLGYRFERSYLQAKFEHLNQDLIKKIGEKRIDVHDLTKEPKLSVTSSQAQLKSLKVSTTTDQPALVQSIYWQSQ